MQDKPRWWWSKTRRRNWELDQRFLQMQKRREQAIAALRAQRQREAMTDPLYPFSPHSPLNPANQNSNG